MSFLYVDVSPNQLDASSNEPFILHIKVRSMETRKVTVAFHFPRPEAKLTGEHTTVIQTLPTDPNDPFSASEGSAQLVTKASFLTRGWFLLQANATDGADKAEDSTLVRA